MRKLLKYFAISTWRLVTTQPWIIFFSACLLFILLINSVHTSYPDEFDNIAGGKLILTGQLPYTGFFTHHAPFAYFLAAFLNLFSGISFVKFRIVYAVFLWLGMLASTVYFYRKVDKSLGYLTASLWLIISLTSIYVWSQMLLADSLAGLLLITPYLLLVWSIWHDRRLSLKQIGLISSLFFFTFLTSFTYLYTVMAGYVMLMFWVLKQEWTELKQVFRLKIDWENGFLPKALLAVAIAPLIFALYLTISWSWSDFLYQAIEFNTKYYIYLPDDVITANPVRMAVVIFMAFVQNFRMILTHVKDFNIYHPFALTIALGHACFWLLSGIKKKWWLLPLSFGMVVFATARSNPLNTGETDYQATVYQFLGLANILLALILSYQHLKIKAPDPLKIVSGFLFVLTGFYLVFFNLSMFEFFFNKAYLKYLGRHPLIYDRPALAPALNQLLDSQETYYIGPFAFEEHYYMKAKLASNHWITIPAMDKSERIQQELISDLETNKPRLILIDHSHFIFGSKPGTFLEPFLAANYSTLGQLETDNQISLLRDEVGTYELRTDWHLNNSSIDRTLAQLEEQGYLVINK